MQVVLRLAWCLFFRHDRPTENEKKIRCKNKNRLILPTNKCPPSLRWLSLMQVFDANYTFAMCVKIQYKNGYNMTCMAPDKFDLVVLKQLHNCVRQFIWADQNRLSGCNATTYCICHMIVKWAISHHLYILYHSVWFLLVFHFFSYFQMLIYLTLEPCQILMGFSVE